MSQDNKLLSLQVLRGVGAIAVVIYHALSLHPFFNFRAGAAGVDLFFVISGIVMYISLRPETSTSMFLWRRIARVVPMYWIATSLAIAYFHVRYPWMKISSSHIIRSYLFAPPPVGHSMPILYPGWTLNYEMFFYLVLGLSLMARQFAAPLVICLIGALGTAFSMNPALGSWYYANQVIAEFAAGMTLGMALKSGYQTRKPVGAICLISSILLFAIHNHYKPEGVLAWGVPSILMVMGVLAFESSRLITNKIVQLFGLASYSIYLFHPLAIWAVDWSWPADRGISTVAFAVTLSTAAGLVAYFLAERPLLRIMSGVSKRPPTSSSPSVP